MPTAQLPHLCDPALSGEQQLLAAVLAQAIRDATSRSVGEVRAWHRKQAQAWLRERETVVAVLELMGLDEGVYAMVLHAAHLEGEHAETLAPC